MTSATVGYGATVQLDNAAGTLTSIGEVVNVTPMSASVGTVDATHLSSTSGYREFIAALTDGGEASVTVNYVPGGSTDALVQAALTDRLTRTFKVTFPNSKYVQSESIVTSYAPGSVTPDGKLEMTFSVKFTGVATFG